jgi:dihydrofolate reductase
MGSVIYYVAASVDGMIADTEGGVGFLEPFERSGEEYGYEAFLGHVGAVVMGSGTYEWLLEAGVDWPYSGIEAVVMTGRRLPQPKGGHVAFAAGDPGEVVRALRARHAQDIWLAGGGKLAAAFVEGDLVDEYDLTIIPVVLGAGIPLLARRPGPANARRLVLVEHQAYPSGVIRMRYVVPRGS